MNKLLFLTVVILVLAVGCLPATPPPSNEPPAAYIDSVLPTKATLGETVTFSGHGVDTDGSIVAYSWRSSLDGDLSTLANFETSSLSSGTHTIWFKVQDDKGDWSKQVLATVIVVPSGGGIGNPVVNSFDANPGMIGTGESSTLSWDVSNAITVSIEPAIGNVALSETRGVLPTETTTYNLTATNEAGSVTVTAQVVVVKELPHKVELYSIAAEDGHVSSNGNVGLEPIAGTDVGDAYMQAFLSFDIAVIPKDAVIESAYLDLTSADVIGSPFRNLGLLYVYDYPYTQLRSRDFFSGPPVSGIISGIVYWTATMPLQPFTSNLLTSAVQRQVDAGSSRFQVRLQFESGCHCMHPKTDYIMLREGEAKLVIQYRD